MPPVQANIGSAHELGKVRRRQRILQEARNLIAKSGYESLNARDLAKAATVTVPTLYNLVGNKEEILTLVVLEAMSQFEAKMRRIETSDAMTYFDALITKSIGLINADPGFYRGSLLAMYQLSSSLGDSNPERLFNKRGIDVVSRGCVKAIDQGLLRGNISSALMGEEMYLLYAAYWREWALRRLSIAEFRMSVQAGFYMLLCADASAAFLQQLQKKISTIRISAIKNA